jgi:hypothetical protein
MCSYSIDNIEPYDDNSEHIENEGNLHRNTYVISDLILKGLIEYQADHDQNGEDEQYGQSCDGLLWLYAQNQAEYNLSYEPECCVHMPKHILSGL